VDGWGVEVGLFGRGGDEERSGGCDGVIPFLLRIAKKMFIFGVRERIRWRDTREWMRVDLSIAFILLRIVDVFLCWLGA
jgi:hypothetical protein